MNMSEALTKVYKTNNKNNIAFCDISGQSGIKWLQTKSPATAARLCQHNGSPTAVGRK